MRKILCDCFLASEELSAVKLQPHLHDAVQLVHRGGAREDRLARDELAQDAPNAPRVHTSGAAERRLASGGVRRMH